MAQDVASLTRYVADQAIPTGSDPYAIMARRTSDTQAERKRLQREKATRSVGLERMPDDILLDTETSPLKLLQKRHPMLLHVQAENDNCDSEVRFKIYLAHVLEQRLNHSSHLHLWHRS